ncbi:hypothetical protein CYLTODRAFT_422883 [Cylindrobasidium torrendii FP15055 ss-10]|uniref:HNH nuclease domain-containing protein n=1 Tax=Cylindrobasidium torrendii FP15055 ss-10 TaxID=1314674 RepID=A0A0D7B9Z7_9AGAR|nr:hypothetical protein CYLTODRAFT_422883 [Cylindrobasidium torrendii FP15055 ss-10]
MSLSSSHRQSDSVDSTLTVNSDDVVNNTFDSWDLAILIKDAKSIIGRTDFSNQPSSGGATIDLRLMLESMLDNAPADQGKRWLAGAIHTAHHSKEEGRVQNAALALWQNLIMPMQAVGFENIVHSSSVTSSLTPTVDQTHVVVENADRAEQKEFAAQLMIRENYRCIVTRYVTFDAPIPPEDVTENVSYARLQASHIIPLSLNSEKTPLMNIGQTWDMLKSWTRINPEDYTGGKITCPENGILLTAHEHEGFGKFKLWFEPVLSAGPGSAPLANTYSVHVWKHLLSNRPLVRGGGPIQVRFSDTEMHMGRRIPPPAPELLKIHAAFSKVLHACGASEMYENWRDDLRKPGRVIDDGSLSYLGLRLHALTV